MIAINPEDVVSVRPLCKCVASGLVDCKLQRGHQFCCDVDEPIRRMDIKNFSSDVVKELIGKFEKLLLEAGHLLNTAWRQTPDG